MTRHWRITLRRKMFDRNPLCYWCSRKMFLRPSKDKVAEMATIEHLRPKSIGGTDDESNLRLVHKKCNR